MKNLLCIDVFEGIDYDRLFYMVRDLGFDGLFSGEIHGDVNLIGPMAACVMEKAIAKAVRASKGAYGLKSAEDLFGIKS